MFFMETIYKHLASLCRWLTIFFRGRQYALKDARMRRKFPDGCRVRIVCDCGMREEDHEGEWFIFDYNPERGDFRVMREIPPPGTNIFNEMYRYVAPEQIQRVTP
jgi:hypothetical protein